jgi:hypothetical protein
MSATNDKMSPEAKKKREDKIDRQMKDSFPASDPPSFSGGKHIVGAPEERHTKPKTGNSRAVRDAEKKVKSGDAKVPHTY